MPCSSASIVNFEQVNIGWLFVLHPLFFSCRGRRTRAVSLNVTASTDWMSFLPSNLIEEIRPNIQKPSAQIPEAFHQHGIALKTMI